MFYSKSSSGFYSESVHGPRVLMIQRPPVTEDPAEPPQYDQVGNPTCKIPLDSVEITEQQHANLLAGQSTGKVITSDEQGKPVLAQRPETPFAEAKAAELAKFRADRIKFMDCISGIAGRFERAGDSGTALACDAFAQGLLDLPAHPAVVAATNITGYRTALLTRYTALVAELPTTAKLAFKGASA